MKEKKLVSLREIEGSVSPHQIQLESALKARGEAFASITDISGLAEFIGGKVEPLGLGEGWAVRKDIFPEVSVYFVYRHADEEFPGSMNVLYSGARIGLVAADILTAVTISFIGYMLGYSD